MQLRRFKCAFFAVLVGVFAHYVFILGYFLLAVVNPSVNPSVNPLEFTSIFKVQDFEQISE